MVIFYFYISVCTFNYNLYSNFVGVGIRITMKIKKKELNVQIFMH